MVTLSDNSLIIVLMGFISLLSLVVTINCAKGVGKSIVSYFITALLFFVSIFFAINKFTSFYSKKQTIALYNQKKVLEQNQKEEEARIKEKIESINNAKEQEAQLYAKEAEELKKDFMALKSVLKQIYSIGDNQYDNILSDDYSFNKEKRVSMTYYKKINTYVNKYKSISFKSKLANKKLKIASALKTSQMAGKYFKKIFYDEMDIYFPKHRISAKKAMNQIDEILNDL